MSLERILAILLLEFFTVKRNLEELIETFYTPLITTFVYGYISIYLLGEVHSFRVQYLILGIVFWEVTRIMQVTVTNGIMWNIWARNLINLFITPLSFKEMTFALMISGVIKAGIVFLMISSLYLYFFQFNVYKVNFISLLLFSINLTMFAWAIGLFLVGLVLRFGTRIQVFTWSFIILFQPLGAVFYPVSVLPSFFQTISRAIPITYVFEGARKALVDSTTPWDLIASAFILNILYLCTSIGVFTYLFTKAKETGQFTKNEG